MSAHEPFLLAAIIIGGLAVPSPTQAKDPNFGSFLKSLEREYNVRRTKIPFFFLAKGIVRIASPVGVSRLDLAIFEDQDFSPLMSARELQPRINSMLGLGWKPFVEVNSRKGERVLLYMREQGKKNVDLFIFVVEHNEAVALLTRINPDRLSMFVKYPDSAWREFR